MHRALDIPEIIYEIIQHLQPQTSCNYCYESPQLRDLAKVARVCKALSEPTLDILWRELDNMLPLLRLLSPLQSVSVGNQGFMGSRNDDAYFMRGQVPLDEWTRFQLYARRVRHLSSNYFEMKDDSIFIELSRLTDGNPLLPSLTRLNWVPPLLSQADNFFLISPSLRSLALFPVVPEGFDRIHHELLDQAYEQLLRRLFARAPFLEEFYIYEDCGPVVASYLPIAEAKHVRVLDITVARSAFTDTTFARAISAMESLDHLKIHLEKPFTPSGGFSNLRHLCVHSDSFSFITGFLSAIGSRRLLSIHIVHCSITNQANAEMFLECLAQCVKHTSLRNLTLICKRFSTSSLHLVSRLADFLKTLLPLHDLETLRIEVCHSLASSDEDVLAMASAWPRLTSLTLLHQLPNVENLSIWSLRHLARLCPNLTRLRLSNVGTQLSDPFPSDAAQVRQHGLEQLEFNCQPFGGAGEHAQVARFLNRLFPNLDLRCPQTTMHHTDVGWSMVMLQVILEQIEERRQAWQEERLRQAQGIMA
ncbi:hypothetical protein B0H21DRAFT_787475 [Amylocystis lapponica]|nr:hypothetical protein B0H21DRAFT_787475 [Amylocystis lapponica]